MATAFRGPRALQCHAQMTHQLALGLTSGKSHLNQPQCQQLTPGPLLLWPSPLTLLAPVLFEEGATWTPSWLRVAWYLENNWRSKMEEE